MKEQILAEIQEKLEKTGLLLQLNKETDIAINAELLDAQWSTGSKKIQYEALILASEKDHVIYMYEKTTEKGAGVSFGMGSELSFQSGRTLFRKVKSVQYGPEGKVFEYVFNLGAIPKTVKEVASHNRWRFKTVLNKNKAMYPPATINK